MNRLFRELFAFIRHPRLLTPSGLAADGAWRDLGMLLALHVFVLLGLFAPALKAWQSSFGLPSPDAFGKVRPGLLIPMVVLVAPVLEEMAFRGWMRGRPRALWLLLCGAVAVALVAMVSHHVAETATSLGFIAALVAGGAGWFVLRRRVAAPGWYVQAFPVVFWLSASAFALSHMMNYPRFSWPLVAMVLPQLWTGLLLGFVRLRIGLPASMLVHGCANAVAISVALALGG